MTRCTWPDGRLCELLGIDLPIVQAPMAGFSTLEMALAVRESGALGSLACAPSTPGRSTPTSPLRLAPNRSSRTLR